MHRSYFTWEEEDANKQGHQDEQRHRTNYDHDKYSDKPEDIAYFEGRKDEERQERIREEERQMQEADEREQQRQMSEQREREEEDFAEMMELERLEYQEYLESQRSPTTEEELFNKIINDEREDKI